MLPALVLFAGAVAAPPRLPPAFEANRGQAPVEVRFVARAPGGTLLLTTREAIFRPEGGRAAVRMRWVGANPRARLEPVEPLPGKVNYFLGNDPRKWRTQVATYARARYRSLYPGVDLTFYFAERRLEYDFELEPGADPSVIRFAFEGRGAARLEPDGDVTVEAGDGILRHHRPAVYQVIDGRRRGLAGRFVQRGRNRFGFEVEPYDRAQPLFIDPVVSYSTYLGGSGGDTPYGLAVDASGYAYVIGSTGSLDFPVGQGAPGPAFRGARDVFVTKLNREGAGIVYSTYLGGRDPEDGWAIALDAQGAAVVTGITKSLDFPVKNAVQNAHGGGETDAFVAKLGPAGDTLLFATYLGGKGGDSGIAVTLDRQGAIYVTGDTRSADFSKSGALPGGGPGGEMDVFVAKLGAAGTPLVYAVSFGGARNEIGNGIKVDASGNAIIGGYTLSPDFPTTSGAYQAKWAGQSDAFLAKLNPSASALLYSTYIGGAGDEFTASLDLDSAGNAYLVGWTTSPAYPTTPGALNGTRRGGSDGFVSKLNSQGSALVYSTLIGGSGKDAIYAVAVDPTGSACLTGATESTDFPITRDAPQTVIKGKADAILAKLDASGSALAYSAYLGGSGSDDGLGIALDPAGNLYVAVEAESADFPVALGALRPQFGGGRTDAVVLKLSTEELAPPAMPANGVVNAASSLGGSIAPGQIVTIYGSRLGPAWLVTHRVTSQGVFDNVLADTRVLIDGAPAPLVYTSVAQVSAIVPYRVAGKSFVELVAEYKGLRSAPVSLPVAAAAPGIFTLDLTGKNQGAILNQDYNVNGAANPAAAGSVVMIYCTGEGQTRPAGVDGKLAADPLPAPVLPVTARVGGQEAEVLYAGAAPGLVAGVFQVNVRIPPGITPGNAVPVVIKVGAFETQPGVTLAVR